MFVRRSSGNFPLPLDLLIKVAVEYFWNVHCVEIPGNPRLNGQRTLPSRVPASADGPLRNWPEWSGRTAYCLSLAREIKAKSGSQAITKNRQLQKTGGEFILCNGMEGNFRHRCVAGAFSLVTFFWAPKESDKAKGSAKQRRHRSEWVAFDFLIDKFLIFCLLLLVFVPFLALPQKRNQKSARTANSGSAFGPLDQADECSSTAVRPRAPSSSRAF